MRVLAIGDTHAPFTHPHYLEFCLRIRDKHRCDRVVHIGDEVDNHALSYHEKDPDGCSAGHEGDRAQLALRGWYKAFPRVNVCIGNHGDLHRRQARTAGLPSRFIKDHREAWGAPLGWDWDFRHQIDGVQYIHGTGFGGQLGHVRAAKEHRQSTVMGHLHSYGGVMLTASHHDCLFGLNVGCGIDIDAYAFAYGRDFAVRPTLGCGVVIDGVDAYFERMLFKNKRLALPQIVVPKMRRSA